MIRVVVPPAMEKMMIEGRRMTGERQEDTPIVPLIVIRVEAPTDTVDEFVAQYCRYFGSQMMFLPTEGFQPPGRRVRFAFALTDGREILWGEGVVMRMRRDSGNPHRPPGMELRYDVLDEPSQAVVDRMLALRMSGAQMGRPEPPPYVSMWLEQDGQRLHEDDTTRRRQQAEGVSLDDLRRQLHSSAPPATLPANPFADVTREALEYFIDWAMQRITEPRRRRVTAEIAILSARPPARALLSFVAGVAVTVAAIGIFKLAGERRPAHPLVSSAAVTAPPAPRAQPPLLHAPAPAHETHASVAMTHETHASVAIHETYASAATHETHASAATHELHDRARVMLSLHATPGDAWLRLDGGAPSQGPVKLSVPPGAHELVVERPRYVTARLHVDAPGRLSVHLSRPPATLRVTSSPSGADVTLDGRGVGVTPLELTVTGYEQHRVDVALDGHERRRRVYVRPPFSTLDVQLNQSARRDTRSVRCPQASAHPASL